MLSVNALQIFSAVLFMLVLPSIGGIPICTLIKTRCTMPSAFMLGLLSEFAFCQLLFVPLVAQLLHLGVDGEVAVGRVAENSVANTKEHIFALHNR